MEVVKFRGLPMFITELFSKEHIQASIDYKPKDDDIIAVTFPKTGTTWLQYIVWQILHRGESYPSFDEASFRLIPYMELTGVEPVEKLEPPRFYKTHLPYTHLNINPNAKYLYVHRNPADTLVSYFYFWNDMRDKNTMKYVPLDEFFESVMSGEFFYGDYFDHVLSFYAHRNDPNVLVLSYEEMKRNPRAEILRIAKFLGEEYYQRLIKDDSLLHKILEVTSFEYMKKHLQPSRVSFDSETDCKENHSSPKKKLQELKEGEKPLNFFRKGVVGDGISHLSEEQRKQMLQKVMEKMEGTELLEPWKKSLSISHK